MTVEEFKAANATTFSGALLALWYDGQGDWTHAHEVAQDVHGRDGAWVHAYLHRKEGDLGNAGYWYRQAGRPVAHEPLDAEWQAMVRDLLAAHHA